MKHLRHVPLLFVILFLLSACAEPERLPLLFTQSHTVGITVGGSAPEQAGEFTFGYKDRNVAIVPVTMSPGTEQIRATITDQQGTVSAAKAEVQKASQQVAAAQKNLATKKNENADKETIAIAQKELEIAEMNMNKTQLDYSAALTKLKKDIAAAENTPAQSTEATEDISDSSSKVQIPPGSSTDALSVLGQFNVNTEGGKNIGLGKFFATGIAAQQLSIGFREKMKNEHLSKQQNTNTTTTPTSTDPQ